jgi:hypothetical protein
MLCEFAISQHTSQSVLSGNSHLEVETKQIEEYDVQMNDITNQLCWQAVQRYNSWRLGSILS